MKTAIKVLAVILGLGLAGTEVWGTYGYFLKDQGEFNYIVAVMCGVTIFTALAPMFMVYCFNERRWGALVFMLITLPLAIAVTFAAALSRTGGTADNGEAQRIHNERVLKTAQSAEVEAKSAYDDAKAAAKTECADGRGLKCDKAEDRMEKAASRLDKARSDTAVAQDPKRDPFYSRVKAMTDALGWHMTEDQLRTYWPIIYPLAMALCAGACLAFGVPHGNGRKPALDPAPKLARRWRWPSWKSRKSPAPAVTDKPDDVPVTVPAIEPDERAPGPFKHGLKLVASSPVAIVDFIVERMETCDGGRVGESDLYKAYMRKCKAANAKPLSAGEFVPVLDKVCNDLGIRREQKGNKVYLVDVQLVKNSARAS